MVEVCNSNNLDAQRDSEAVNHPAHYGGDVPYEVIKVLKAWEQMFDVPFTILTAIKYLPRAGHKANEIQDLEKAIWYIQNRITELKDKDKNKDEDKNMCTDNIPDKIYWSLRSLDFFDYKGLLQTKEFSAKWYLLRGSFPQKNIWENE